MNKYNVVLLEPAGYAHALGLWELCQLLHYSLESLGFACALEKNKFHSDAINVVVGYHLITDISILGDNRIIFYQLEQLSDREGWLAPQRLEILKRAEEIWDYSPENVAFLNSKGLANVKLLPIGFHEKLRTIPDSQKDIDVLFYGSINPRREAILKRLGDYFRVHVAFGAYGQDRDALISRSKIVLNLHYYDTQIFEQARVSYLLNNGCFVLSETSSHNPYAGMLVTADYDRICDGCAHYLADDTERLRIARHGMQEFSRRPMTDFMRAVLPTSAPGKTTMHTLNPLSLKKNTDDRGHARPEVVDLLVKSGVKAQRAIELGCSSGLTGEKIKSALGVAHYVGIDSSEDAANLARAKIDEVHVVDIQSKSPESLGLKEQDYDLLVALDVLEHLYDPWEILADWKRLLRPGGHVIVSIPNVQNITTMAALAEGQWRYESAGLLDATHLRFFTKNSIAELLTGAGFSMVTMTGVFNPAPDLARILEVDNTVNFGKVSIHKLTREQVLEFCVYQYIALARRDS